MNHLPGQSVRNISEVCSLSERVVHILFSIDSLPVDDPKLEKMRKEALRDGDPMAEYFAKNQEKERSRRGKDSSSEGIGNGATAKPLYKGPNPTPNRFGIRPGYRWDAIDRGNGFEKKVLLSLSEKSALKEDEYKWRVSDL